MRLNPVSSKVLSICALHFFLLILCVDISSAREVPFFKKVKSAYDGETGGPWDPVQMRFNGTRLFVKVGFSF